MSNENVNALSVLTRDSFFAALEPKARFAIVDIPDIGAIGIAPLTPAVLEKIDAEAKNDFDRAVRTVLACVVGSDGAPLFANRDEVANLPLPVFQSLSEAVGKQNGLKKAEDVAKN